MRQDAEALRSAMEITAQAVRAMSIRLKRIQGEVQALGFIARSFVEKDISSSTGRSLADWARAADTLASVLDTASRDEQAQGRATQAIAAERPRLAALRAYLERAPQKVGLVPGAVLKPAQRADFLREVGDRTRAIKALEQDLARLAESLASAGVRSPASAPHECAVFGSTSVTLPRPGRHRPKRCSGQESTAKRSAPRWSNVPPYIHGPSEMPWSGRGLTWLRLPILRIPYSCVAGTAGLLSYTCGAA